MSTHQDTFAATQTKETRLYRAPASTRTPALTRVLGYVLVAPIVIVMGVVIAYPLVTAVVTSLKDERIIGTASDFVGFDSYVAVFRDQQFWSALSRSGIWLALNLVVQTILGFSAALLLQRRSRWSRTARTWIVLPWAIPSVAVVVLWQWMLNTNYGIIYKAFASIGIDLGAPFGSSTVSLFAIVLVNSWHWFPLTAVVVYGALSTVPPEMIEAAKMDGASAGRVLFAITLPTIGPVLFALGLVGSLWSVNVLDSIYLITKGGPANATTTMPVYIYNTAFTAFRSSQAAAASVITVIILLVAALIFVRFARPEED